MSRIFDSSRDYTFSQYFYLSNPIDEVLAEFGYTYQKIKLNLTQYSEEVSYLGFLSNYLERNQNLTNPIVEISIREFLIAPVITEVGYHCNARVYSEYPLEVNNLLKGSLDYYLKNTHSLLVVEAKQADLKRGFTQLATELIALDKYLDNTSNVIYGAVTNGDTWKFGVLTRDEKLIQEDRQLYNTFDDLESIVRIMMGILK